MLKLPFRYALSAVYAKLVIEDVVFLIQNLAAAGWYNLFLFLEPAYHWYKQRKGRRQKMNTPQKPVACMKKKLIPDEATLRIVKEVCVDLNTAEVKVLMWDRMNAGYVFHRIYLPVEWKDWFSEDELRGIIAHELGHLKLNSDAFIPLRLVNRMGDELFFSMLPVHITGAFLLLMSILAENPSYLKALSLTVLFRLIHFLIENYFCRRDEYKADQYGVIVTDKDTMKSALSKISQLAKKEIFDQLRLLPAAKQFYYRWLLKGEKGVLRELFLDHPYLEKRLKSMIG